MKLEHKPVIAGMHASEYHSLKQYASQSILWTMRQSTPLHAAVEYAKPSDSTEAMRRGSAFHFLALRPKDECPYVISPYDEFRTDESKAWRKAQTLDVMKKKELIAPAAMADAMRANEDFQLSTKDARVELSIFFELNGVACRSRIDIAPKGYIFLGDLKSVQSCNEEALIKNAWFDGWWLQAIMYLRGWNRIHPDDYRSAFKFLCIEAEPPHAIRVVYYRMETEIMEYADQELAKLLEVWRHCKQAAKWPGYDPTPLEISAPGFALKGIKNALANAA